MDNFELPRLFAERPDGHNYVVGTEECPVAPGSAVFVPAGVAHHFHSIAAELQVLVVFAPAETPIAT